ncbi:hypothetical protein PHISCL_08833 [Aspergillus sclerotialis]|uniref:Uncharacterized protein n=1 Tax=Aspergillus sclerotialis TaxID=2070753 RepID=A0A3A2Z6V0_9EURO|nr:hypothetical protein PHISCL_08833 [Aspergillus sclerotialis]
MVLPGQVYRHRIMASLVHVSPSGRVNGTPFYDNGMPSTTAVTGSRERFFTVFWEESATSRRYAA